MNNTISIYLKNIRDDFTATPNPFNQNLNYEKILRFSTAKIQRFFIPSNIYLIKIGYLSLINVNKTLISRL